MNVRDDVLILNDVQPLAVLAADLNFPSDQAKPDFFVESDGSLVFTDNSGDEGVKSQFRGHIYHLAQEDFANPSAPSVTVGVNGAFDSGGVGRAGPKGGNDGKTEDFLASSPGFANFVLVVNGHDAGVGTEMLIDPLLLLFEGARDDVERDRGLNDLGVIDGGEGRSIGAFNGASVHGTHASGAQLEDWGLAG